MAKVKDLEYIVNLETELSQIQDFDVLLERILFEARKVLHADAGSIYTTLPTEDPNVEKLSFRYSQNDTLQKNLPPGQKLIYSVFTLPINEKSVSGYCALTKTLINIPDMYSISKDAPYSFNPSFDKISGYKSTSCLNVPLLSVDNRITGVIQVLNAIGKAGKIRSFSTGDEVIITHFAAKATIALQRASTTRAMILRMIKMSELRDPKETGTHVNRVAGYSLEIYDRWAYRHNIPKKESEKFRDILKISAMLHDVGKVAISDTILKKPARFTEEEYRIMQNHTIYGASLFTDTVTEIDALARDIAMTHHENWDGTGYPGWISPEKRADIDALPVGRIGDEIPLGGRIVAIADVFDALCSRRVYKEPWDEDQVLKEMRNLSGTKFDPELIDIFFEVLPSIKQTQNRYPES
jgi:HD-GYP domain-containing protein (c-di-GMP phosphodiesterase class II)